MFNTTSRCLTLSMQQVGGVALGVTTLLLSSPFPDTLAAPLTVTVQDRRQPTTVSQLFKRRPAKNGCPPTGCRLSIDQTLLPKGKTLLLLYNGKDRQVIPKGETRKLTVTLIEPIQNRVGQTVVPAESPIEGEIVPVEGGGQFVANRITVNDKTYPFLARSGIIHDTKDPTQTDAGAMATDAASGAAGGVVLGQILGQRGITTEQVIGGAVAGVLVGNVTAPQAVVINKGDKIEVQITENFKLQATQADPGTTPSN